MAVKASNTEKMERRHAGHDMSSMGGMSMGGPNSFQGTNMGLAHDFWYIIAAVLGFLALCRLVNLYKSRTRFVLLIPPFPFLKRTPY